MDVCLRFKSQISAMLYMCMFMSVHTPFGPAVADLVLAAAVHARDAMPPRALIDQPLPGGDRKHAVVGLWGAKPAGKKNRFE